MADYNLEVTALLAKAVRLQKSVNPETSVKILSRDIASQYQAPETLAKLMAEAAVAGDESLLKATADKVFTIDFSERLGAAGISHLPPQPVTSNEKHGGMKSTTKKLPEGHPNPGVKKEGEVLEKSEEESTEDLEKAEEPTPLEKVSEALTTKITVDTETAIDALEKALPEDCGHCFDGCTCGRITLKLLRKAFPPQVEEDEPDDVPEDAAPGPEESGDLLDQGDTAPGAETGMEAELPLPGTGSVEGVDTGAAMAAPPASNAAAALQTATQIAELVEMIQDLVTGGPGGDDAPQFDPAQPGGAKGSYLENEGGGVPPPGHGLMLSAQRLHKALSDGKFGDALEKTGFGHMKPSKVQAQTPHEKAKNADMVATSNEGDYVNTAAAYREKKKQAQPAYSTAQAVSKEDAPLATGTEGAYHENYGPTTPKAKRMKKALDALGRGAD